MCVKPDSHPKTTDRGGTRSENKMTRILGLQKVKWGGGNYKERSFIISTFDRVISG
jgi:hypothetical protein